MQNWNQWQLPAATVTASIPQPPIGFAAPGADPMATMQSYMQYYNQPAPSGYTADQWAAAQQQNWVQWQTWQQQYQQWQAQYGEKYQETMKQMSSQGLPGLAQVPSLPVIQPPPLPKEDMSVKPPLPPEGGAYGIPPPHQNNLPLFPSKQTANPPLPPGQPPLPPETSPTSANDGNLTGKRGASSNVDTSSAKKLKIEDDELTEAEKTFDAQFKQWEEQFNKWKQQNANHPDKTQYKQYEAKWTSWREKLIERREQMRRKREQQKQTAAKAAEKNKTMSGDDKILNILSSTENQGLINNLLGIGKTLGLTGKPEKPEPQTEQPSAPSMVQPPSAQNPTAMGAPTMTANMNQAAWAAQQWAAQYNAGMNMTSYAAGYQQSPAIPSPANMALGAPMLPTNFNHPPGNFNQPPGNFNQPPPGMPVGVPNMSNMPPNMSAGGPNFSLPPPAFGTSDNSQKQSSSDQEQKNYQDSSSRTFRSDGDQRQGAPFSRDSIGSANDRFGFEGNRFSGPPPNDRSGTNRGGQLNSNDNYGRDGPNKDFGSGNQSGSGSDNFRRDSGCRDFSPSGRSGNDFRSNDRFGNDNDRFGSGTDRDQGDRSERDADRQDQGNNRFGSDRDSFNPDRFNNSGDRFGSNNDRFSSGNDRFGSGNDRFGFGNDRLSLGNDQSRPSGDRFGSSNDRFSSGNDKFGSATGDRFGSSNERPGVGGDRLGQSSDKFNRPPPDRFDSRDGSRDSFGSNSKTFGRNNQFDPSDDMPPELKKLMEKRRAAMDVFKPSNFGSFLDTDRTNTASSSLSESFRKITGDSPFASRSTSDSGNKDSFAPRGPPPGPGGSGNFDSSRDIRPGDNSDFNFRGPGDFRSRGPGDFPPRGNEFGSRGPDTASGPRRSGDFAPKTGNEFESRMRNEFESSRKENEQQRDIYGLPDNQGSTEENSERMSLKRDGPLSDVGDERKGVDEKSNRQYSGTDDSNAAPNNEKVPPLQIPPWMDPDFDNDDIVELPTSKMTEPPRPPTFSNTDKDNSPISADSGSTSVKSEKSHDTPEGFKKKSDVLPFMGENDPKPEDLNMEPPPELPNLGPVIKGPDSPFQQRGRNMSGPFGPPSGDFDSRQHFDAPFGPRGMPRGPMPPFGPRGPNDGRFPPFGPRGCPPENMRPMGSFGPQGPNIGTFGPRGSQDDRFNLRGPSIGPFGPRGPGDFGPRGPPDFVNRGSSDYGPRDSNDKQFGPRGLGDRPFGPRGPVDRPFGPNDGPFGPCGPNDGPFGPCGPNDGPFGPCGPNDGPFGPCGPNDRSFGPCGPNDGPFGLRGPNDGSFGPRGPNDGPHGPRGPNAGAFGPRGPNDGSFGPHGPNNSTFESRGPNDGPFGPHGPNNAPFEPRGPNDGPLGPHGPNDAPFEPCGPNDGPFGPHGPNNAPFEPRGPNDGPFSSRGSNDSPLATRAPFGSNTLASRGSADGSQGSIPSLMSLKFDKRKSGGPNEARNDEFEGDLPPAFRAGDQDLRAFAGDGPQGDAEKMAPEVGSGSNKQNPHGLVGPDWKQPFIRNKFGDFDQRTGPGDLTDGPHIGPGDAMNIDRDRKIPSVEIGKNKPSFGPEERMLDKGGQNIKSRGDKMSLGYNEPPGGLNGPIANFMTRRSDNRRGMRGGPQKEFCIEKQFNYNHSGGVPDEISTEHTPAKVVDYGHAPRVVVKDYVTPAQCFDYGHGRLKPNVQDHEIFSKQDFRYWVENEHNLKEYTDRMKVYECDLRALNRVPAVREPEAPLILRQPAWIQEERRSYERDRRSRNDRSRRDRDTDDYRDREKEREIRDRGRLEREREWERISSKHREDRSHQRRSTSRDRTREKPEKIRKESNKENSKDDERSKGNVSGQENPMKKPDEATSQENSQEEAKNEEPEVSPKTMELPNTMEPRKTMELPKTPNFTMIDDLLCPPGRQNRPPKIVVILRGPPGSGKSFVAKLIKDKEVEQGGSAPRILSLDDYFLTEKEVDTVDDNGKKVTTKDMVYEYEEAMEPSYITSLVKAFKKNITDGFFNFIILDSINEKISDYEEMWSFAKTKGFRVYVCEMEMDVQICLKRNIHQRTEDEVNRIVDYFEPTPSYHQKLDVTSMLQEEAIEEVHMEDSQEVESTETPVNDDSQDSQEDCAVVSKWERMEANDKLDRLDGLAKRKNEGKPQTMEDFLQVPDYYNMEDTSGKRRVRWADLEERKEQEKMRAVGFVVGQTNWDRMMDPTKGGSALTRTKYI